MVLGQERLYSLSFLRGCWVLDFNFLNIFVMTFKSKFLKEVGFFIVFSCIVFGVAEGVDLKGNKIQIKFRSQLHEKSNLINLKLNHPIKISLAEITNHLISLRYKTTFLGSKVERVFLLSEIKSLAPILLQAFASVPPEKIIYFQLDIKEGVTSGEIFSFKNYLNWRFDSIHGETFFKKNDVRDARIFAWNLTPESGQRFFVTRSDKRTQKNWIISSLKLPVVSSKMDKSSPTKFDTESSNVKVDPKLEAKLKHLKYLHSKKLIDDDEYKAQQKKLFDKHF